MNKELLERIRQGLEKGKSSEELKTSLVGEGFLEDEVIEAIQNINWASRSKEDKKNDALFSAKEVLDRIGYGFSNVQFINVLFMLSGAGIFLIGLINGLKAILSVFLSSFFQEYGKVSRIDKKFIGKAGIVFGMSFLVIAAAIVSKSLILFSLAILIGSVGVVAYGDLYNRMMEQTIRKEKTSLFLNRISHFGVLITGLCTLVAGWLFDKFPIFDSAKVEIFGRAFPLYGYLIAFELTAICLILSGYVLYFIKEKSVESTKISMRGFLMNYYALLKVKARGFVADKHVLTLLIAGSIVGLVQVLGNAYYGIFIYKTFNPLVFNGVALGGFLCLAIILSVAILVSFIGPAFSGFLNRRVGLAPCLVFGTLLLAMMPLVAAFNPHFLSVLFAYALSVLGSSILGTGQGLLVRKLLPESQREIYYASLSKAVMVPLIVLLPLGAFAASALGLAMLFKILALILLVLAAPMFFTLVVFANKHRL